ncbi:MAG TPA: hypothetical protein VF021_03395 [Longimicrobiales bacterium]
MRDHAIAAGRNAWIFRALESDDHFTEFLEWSAHDPDEHGQPPALAEALDTLNAAFMAEDSHTWIEAKI